MRVLVCRSLEPTPLTLLQLSSHCWELYEERAGRGQARDGSLARHNPSQTDGDNELSVRQKYRDSEVLKVSIIHTSFWAWPLGKWKIVLGVRGQE